MQGQSTRCFHQLPGLPILTINMKTGVYSLGTVVVSPSSALFTGATCIVYWLQACALTNLKVFNPVPDFDNNSCAFMSCTSGPERRHCRESWAYISRVQIGPRICHEEYLPQSFSIKCTSDMHKPVALSLIRTSSGPDHVSKMLALMSYVE